MADLPGYISDTELYYDTDIIEPPPPTPEGETDNSVEDCCQVAPPGESSAGPVLEAFGEWVPICVGGGQAPDTTPVVNSENWSV